jgi:hypothetical protein
VAHKLNADCPYIALFMQPTPTPTPTFLSELSDPASWSGAFSVHVIGALVGGLLLVAAIAALSLLFFPVKWWWRKRELRKLIRGRVEFILVYNPHTEASKPVVFLDNGQIGAGKNQNEDTWRIKHGCLEFLTDDGRVYSRPVPLTFFPLGRKLRRVYSQKPSIKNKD